MGAFGDKYVEEMFLMILWYIVGAKNMIATLRSEYLGILNQMSKIIT